MSRRHGDGEAVGRATEAPDATGEVISRVATTALSGIGDGWRTPPSVLNPVRDFCRLLTGSDRIDVDPCSGPGSLVDARREIALPWDGLLEDWPRGVAFVNPPYSAPARWISRCEDNPILPERRHSIALVNAATSERWWPTTMQAVCFWRGRIKFLSPTGQAHHANTRPSALIYWGCAPALFEHVFSEFGWVVRN